MIQNKLVGEFTEVMTYKRLARDLNEIEQEFDDTMVRLLSNPLELQKSITITGAIMRRRLLIELEVPIIDRRTYSLNKIIKLPMRDNSKVYAFKIPHTDYLVQQDTKQFIPMSPSDLSQCHEISRKQLLCYPQRETHYSDDSSCESNILFNNTEALLQSCALKEFNDFNWIIGLDNNQYYISPKRNITFVEKCITQPATKSTITQTGILIT